MTLQTLKIFALGALLGALLIIGLNSTGRVINVSIWQPMPLLDMPELGRVK